MGESAVDVRKFGALGNGRHDDTNAIQNAIDTVSNTGGTIRIPARDRVKGEYWRLTRPLLLKSRVALVGEGPDSLLFNDREHSLTFMDQAVILPGNYHPQFLNCIAFDPISQDKRDKTVVFVDNRSGRYSKGQTVFVRSADFDSTRAEVSISTMTIICLIVEIEHDRAYLDRSLELEGATVMAPADDQIDWRPIGPPSRCFVSVDSAARNLAIRSYGFWTGDSAARGCEFSQLWIESRAAIYGNLFQDCRWTNINAKFDRFAIELSCNSFNVVIDNFTARMTSDPPTPNHQIVAIQESSRNCRIVNFSIDAKPFSKTGAVVRFGPSSHCSIENGNISCEGARGAIVSFDTGAATVSHNSIRNVTFSGFAAQAGIVFEAQDAGLVIDNEVDKVNIRGLARGVAARLGGQRNVISDCELTGTSLSILDQARNCTIRDSIVPANIDNRSSQPHSIQLLRNRVSRE
jgi:pectate lyase-like protein